MSFNFEATLNSQVESYEQIKKICSNYKKDSSSRKTVDYLEKRLLALNAHWQEFECNNEILLQLENKDIEYFNDNIFEITKAMYEETKQSMSDLLLKLSSKAPPQPATPARLKFNVPPTEAIASSSKKIPAPTGDTQADTKLQELLSIQRYNFKAFNRVASKINIDTIVEKWELEDCLTSLKAKWDNIEKLHAEIEIKSQGKLHYYDNEFTAMEDDYDNLKKAINRKLWNSAHYEKSTPRMQIPDFTGNYNQWISFKDIFIESVHNNPLLSQTQKMQHLKSKVKGEAERLIQHLAISADNYTASWDILTHRYDNIRLLFTSYINTLLGQPIIQQANAQNIKKLHDVSTECLNGLSNIGIDTTTWDPIIVHLLSQKLDSMTYGEYIKDLKAPRELPELNEFMSFLESKFMAYETLKTGQNQKSHPDPQSPYQQKNNYNNNQRSSYFKPSEKMPKTYFTTTKTCPTCKTSDHVLMNCNKFIEMNYNERKEIVAKLQLCENCLYSHGTKQCYSNKKCKLCNKAHHTLLHQPMITSSGNVNNITKDEKEVLLTTVQLQVKAVDNSYLTLRALLDQGSQVSLITESAAQRLRLPRRKLSAVVSGVGSVTGNCKGMIHLDCKSIHSDYSFKVTTLIMNKLMNNLPTSSFSTEKWDYLNNIKLADPEFNKSAPVDMLLGADVYAELLLDGVLKADNNCPIAQQTNLGWILCGNVKTYNCMVTLNELEAITKFWETEDLAVEEDLSERDYCEKYYSETTERKPDGKYIVKMPMLPDFEEKMGKTKTHAISQFFQLEKKMKNNSQFQSQYTNFINEYIDMGHMTPATTTTPDQPQVYLPHHGVIKEDSTTTKLRVVFNASQKSDTKLSLNDLMYTGPNLQKDIFTLMIHWRAYRYVLTADVEKMYRNIMLHSDQQHLQKIIWRERPEQPLQEFQLCTVTYGTRAAPYLAMRTLLQLAEDDGHLYPDAAHVLKNFLYMDDLVHGHDNYESAKKIVHDLIAIMKRGGFNLRKWISNDSTILENVPKHQLGQQKLVNFAQQDNHKTLGLKWDPIEDAFILGWKVEDKRNRLTKRSLLSDISSLYDPLGWLSPVVIKAKLLFQKLWIDNIGWDESLPTNITNEWEKLRNDLHNIKQRSLKRWLSCSSDTIELHGFCDASEKAYAAVVYSRTTTEDGQIHISLVAAKTRVAPLKKIPTLPRMELCAALLLSKLIDKVKNALSDKQLRILCWSDSKVALAWIQRDLHKSERYIANRVQEITKLVPLDDWLYVKSEENSADCATRGLLPSQLLNFTLWWSGPVWLKTFNLDENQQIKETFKTETGIKTNSYVTTTECKPSALSPLLNKCSNLTRATRVVCWILRFISSVRSKLTTKYNKYLSIIEMDIATEFIIRDVQQQHFYEDIQQIKKTGTVASKSKLLNLTPFLDEKGLLRVKGRLENSTLTYDAKHPIILPQASRLTSLVIYDVHKRTLHGGARLTLGQTRQKFWIIGGNKTIKKQLRQCVICHRFKAHRNEQLMANLPKERITPSRPFTNTGIDFTGHVDLKINKGRGIKTCKGYVAIFICMVTKAVHLELVSDLSTETFIAAFKRMCSRRGKPKHVFTDNGTNFIGAARKLSQEFEQYKTFYSTEFHDEMNKQQIEWHFNAPLWPTAGGLWEAAVKSMKFHLRRTIGEQKLTYEQFMTLLTEVEACLNSRPLCALTEDIDDLDYLTPGHFLVNGPLLSLPHGETNSQLNIRNRWKLVEQMHLHIWKRWSSEYLHHMQIRSKWQKPSKNLTKGDVVLVKDVNLPPGKWLLGRVEDLHPGPDGYVRVVTVKTKTSSLKRPITKLAPLPIQEQTTPPAQQ